MDRSSVDELAKDRVIIFISGVGTESFSAVNTFDDLAAFLADRLKLSDKGRIIHFSYSGQWHTTMGPAANAKPQDPLVPTPDRRRPRYESVDICDGAEAASQHLRYLMQEYPDARFDVIGHSFGGFVAAYFLASLGKYSGDVVLMHRVHSVTTLDSPLAGIEIFGLPESGQDEAVRRIINCPSGTPAAADVVRGSRAQGVIESFHPSDRHPHFMTVGNDKDFLVGQDISHPRPRELGPSEKVRLDLVCALADPSGHGCVLRDGAALQRIGQLLSSGWRQDRARPPDDAGDSIGSAARIRFGQPHEGTIDIPTDMDFFRFATQRDRDYQIEVTATTHPDTRLLVYDASGKVVAERDDKGKRDSLRWRPTRIGEYFVAVRSSSNAVSGTGGYQLTIKEYGSSSHYLTVTIVKPGTGSGNVVGGYDRLLDCGNICAAQVPSELRMVLEARPDEGSVFGGWVGLPCGTARTCEMVVSTHLQIIAAFYKVSSPFLHHYLFSQNCIPGLIGSRIEMEWTPVPGATAYHIYRNGVLVQTVTRNRWDDHAMQKGWLFEYQVVAQFAGAASRPSNSQGIPYKPECFGADPRDLAAPG